MSDSECQKALEEILARKSFQSKDYYELMNLAEEF